MKVRKVSHEKDDKLIVESIGFADGQSAVPSLSSRSCSYYIYYVLSGRGYVNNRAVLGTDCAFRGNFADKVPAPNVYRNGILDLPSSMMTLVFFTAPETGIYTSRITASGNEEVAYCNIYYFIGNDKDGYRIIEMGNSILRHDPRRDPVTFTHTVTLSKNDSLVIGIGNYTTAKLFVDEFSVMSVASEDGDVWHLKEEPEAPFSVYTHPHGAQFSHVEKKGEGFVITPSTKTSFHPDPKTPWSYFYISFCGENAEAVYKEHISTDRYGVFAYCFSDLIEELKDIILRTDRPLPSSLALAILHDILSRHTLSLSPASFNIHVEAAKEFMIKNYQRKLSVKEVANELHLSDRYLYNLFIEHEGIPPKQYLDNLRMDKAKMLLSDRSKSISEIAASLGFNDAFAFSRFFSNRNGGIPPSLYRASCN